MTVQIAQISTELWLIQRSNLRSKLVLIYHRFNNEPSLLFTPFVWGVREMKSKRRLDATTAKLFGLSPRKGRKSSCQVWTEAVCTENGTSQPGGIFSGQMETAELNWKHFNTIIGVLFSSWLALVRCAVHRGYQHSSDARLKSLLSPTGNLKQCSSNTCIWCNLIVYSPLNAASESEGLKKHPTWSAG